MDDKDERHSLLCALTTSASSPSVSSSRPGAPTLCPPTREIDWLLVCTAFFRDSANDESTPENVRPFADRMRTQACPNLHGVHLVSMTTGTWSDMRERGGLKGTHLYVPENRIIA